MKNLVISPLWQVRHTEVCCLRKIGWAWLGQPVLPRTSSSFGECKNRLPCARPGVENQYVYGSLLSIMTTMVYYTDQSTYGVCAFCWRCMHVVLIVTLIYIIKVNIIQEDIQWLYQSVSKVACSVKSKGNPMTVEMNSVICLYLSLNLEEQWGQYPGNMHFSIQLCHDRM